jgi:endonuclease-8
MEGPSLVILKEELADFKGKIVKDLIGNTSIDKDQMCGKELRDILTWGKHLILKFDDFFLRVHFLMYGSYRINERKDMPVRLSLIFDDGEVNFYNCSIKLIEDHTPEEIYDWRVDTMSAEWNPKFVLKKIHACEHQKVCDLLMDQNIFAGVGNIIKNEVLFEQRMDPNSMVDALSNKQIKDLIAATREYVFKFYEWKKKFELKKHWQIMRKRICPRDNVPIVKKKTGKLQRWSFYCTKCQVLYS